MIRPALLAVALVACAASRATADDWPDFRGPLGTGLSAEKGLPVEWADADGERRNVAWKVPVPGRGWSSPIVVDGKVWLTTALEEERSLRALAFDAGTGRLLHDVELFRPAAFQAHHHDNSYASPAPVAADGRIFFSFGAYGTAALDAATAAVVWRDESFVVDHEVGPGSSPIAVDGKLVVTFDGTDRQLLVAFDAATGRVAWTAPRRHPSFAEKKGMHRKAFSTPLAVRWGAGRLLISPAAAHVVALDAATGAEVWRVDYGDGYSEVARPVIGRGMVFVSTGYIKPQLLAIRLGGEGDVTATHVAWETHWQVPANPSPLVVGDRIFMVSDWGIATWLDVLTGEELWHARLGGHFWASPVAAEGRIYTFGANGTGTVLAAEDTYRVLAVNRIDGQVRSSPAFADGAIFLRTATHLYRLALGSPRPPTGGEG